MSNLTTLHVKGFKCLFDTNINFRRLTVFVGGNSVGKSTILQSLLLSRITSDLILNNNIGSDSILSKIRVPVNGKYFLNLGNSSTVISSKAESNQIEFELTFDSNTIKFVLGNDDVSTELNLSLKEFIGTKELLKSSTIGANNFYYLNAERIGPRHSYDLTEQEYPHAGWQGEVAVQILAKLGLTKKIAQTQSFEGDQNLTLRNQVIKWMNFIIPDIDIQSKIYDEINKTQGSINGYSPYNVGFGISYILPIVVNGLLSGSGEMLIVENPEAHLHPFSQSRIGRFLAMVASSGTQVIVETHSEHIINGIRIYALINDLSPSDILINYIAKGEKPGCNIQEINLNPNADITSWPKGFFDQTQNDFAEMIKFRKK